MKEGLSLYNSFYTRFILFFADRGFDRCVVVDGDNIRVDFTIALQYDWDLVGVITAWDEWKALETWLNDNEAQQVDFIVVVRQIAYIVNEQKLFSITRAVQRRDELPRLDQGLIGEPEFASVVLDGHNTGFIPINGQAVVLIQGLKLRREVQVGSYGRFIQLNEGFIDCLTQRPVYEGANHLYSGFLTNDPVFLERKGLVSLMAALRSFQYARSGDLRFCWTVHLYKSLTGRETTGRAAGTVKYSEETSLFGTEAPRLTVLGKPGAVMLARHIEKTLEGHQKNLIASELLNRAFLAPKHLRVPSLFSALEAVFYIRSQHTKKKAVAALIAEVLNLSRGRADFLIKMYELRNAIMHGDDDEQQKISRNLWSERFRYETKTDATSELTKVVCHLFRELMARSWDAKPDTRQLERCVYKNPLLRDLLQNK